MSASLKTRDGALSVVATMMAQEKKSAEVVPIGIEAALQWARDNKIPVKSEKNVVERINRARAAKGLPKFEVISGCRDESSPLPEARVSRSTDDARLPLAISEEELLVLIVNHDGTLHRTITPEIAGWLLALNTHNRRLDRHWVNRFIQILKGGEWLNTGEPIILSREAILNDGQHRLQAIKESGISAQIDVRFGIARTAFHATGSGKRRSASDVLAMEGYFNTTCQAAIGRLLHVYDQNKMGSLRDPVEAGVILKVVERNDDIGEFAAKIQKNKLPMARSSAFGLVLVIAARTAPKESILQFVETVAGGLAQSEEDAARCLHVKFRDLSIARTKLHQEDIAAMSIKAWNAWANDEAVLLRVNNTERTSPGFPRIIDWKQTQRGGLISAK